jgi:hypothetical protein
MKTSVLIGLRIALAFLVVCGAAFVFLWVPTPGCDDQRTRELVLQILRDQFHISGELLLQNIRTESGGVFAKRHECAAEVQGINGPASVLGLRFNQVYYTSEVTEDTQRQYVTARMVPTTE